MNEVEEAIPALQSYARAMLRDPVRADDLVQDCLERALRKRHLWAPKGAVRSWFFKMMLDIHSDQLRSPHAKARFEAVEGFGYAEACKILGIPKSTLMSRLARGRCSQRPRPAPCKWQWMRILTFVSEVIHPVEVQAAEEDHLLKWLSNRLGGDIQAPDLGSAGFSLLGGRLLPNMGQNAGQFMYENNAGARVTLYVTPTPDAAEVAFQFLKLNGLEAFIGWTRTCLTRWLGRLIKTSCAGWR